MGDALRFELRPGLEWPKGTWMTWEPDGSDLLGEAGVLKYHDEKGVCGEWPMTRAEAITEAGTTGYQPLVTSTTSHSVRQSTRKGG